MELNKSLQTLGFRSRRVGGMGRPSRRLIIEDEIDEDNDAKTFNIDGTESGEEEPARRTRVGRGTQFRKDRLAPVFMERPRRRRTADYLVSHPSPRQLKVIIKYICRSPHSFSKG